MFIGFQINPGYRPPGYVPSIWPYVVYISGFVLLLAGLFSVGFHYFNDH